MKKKIFLGLAVVFIAWIGYRVYYISNTRSHSASQITRFKYRDLDLTVVYCRPSKNGRVIFGEAKDRAWLPNGKFWTVGLRVLTGLPPTTGALVPNGVYWRLGANEATQITFSKNVNFAGRPLNAGTYRMYALPNTNTWQVSLNSELGQWGYFEPNHTLDVLKVDVPVASTLNETEKFTIDFDADSAGLKMDFLWDKTVVRIPITIQ